LATFYFSGLQNGDMKADPDIEMKIYPDKKGLKPLHIKTITLAYIKLCI